MRLAKAAAVFLLASGAAASPSEYGATFAASGKMLVQVRMEKLEAGLLSKALEQRLAAGVKVKILLSESGQEALRLRKLGAKLRFATLKPGEERLVVADARWALQGCCAQSGPKAAALSVGFEKRWRGASASEQRQWERELKSLPDPRSPEDSAPRVKTRRRKG